MNEEIKSKKLRLLDSLCSGHASHTRFWTEGKLDVEALLRFPSSAGRIQS